MKETKVKTSIKTKEDAKFNNLCLRWVTMIALTYVVANTIIAIWHIEGFTFNTPMIVLWLLSLIWVIAFLYSNCFRKSKKKKNSRTVTKTNNNHNNIIVFK